MTKVVGLPKIAIPHDNGVNGVLSKADKRMLTIPFDGPSLEGRRAIVSTGLEMLRGVVVATDRMSVSLAIDGKIREIPASDVRVISLA